MSFRIPSRVHDVPRPAASRRVIVTLAAGALSLSACGGAETTPTTSGKPSPTASAAAAPLTAGDLWVKAADKGMSAAFGTLVNTTGAEITVVSGTTPATPKVELHEVVGSGGQMRMRPKEGGFVIPPHGRLELRPGGFHIMLMDVTKPIRPGDTVAFSLTLKDGRTVRLSALGKAFKGGREHYQPGH